MFQKHFKNFCFIWLVWGISFQNGASKETFRISGRVLDEELNKPLANVNVIVRKTTLGAVSKSDGTYELKLPPGEFEIEYSMIGYEMVIQKVKVINAPINIQTAYLTPRILPMPGITVVGLKTVAQKQIESMSGQIVHTMQASKFPFMLNDVNRALKLMPGVTSNNERSSELNVRGGTREENLTQVDGIRIYNPFHMKEVYNTSVSMLDLYLMEKATLLMGGFPAKYGDKLSSTLNIKYRSGDFHKYRSQLELGTTRFACLLEGPIHKYGSCIISMNKSYFELPFGFIEKYKIIPKFYSITAIPKYYDLQGKLLYNISSKHQCSFIFLLSGDSFSETPDFGDDFLSKQTSDMVLNTTINENWQLTSNYRTMLAATKSMNHLSKTVYLETTLSYYGQFENYDYHSNANFNSKVYGLDNVLLGTTTQTNYSERSERIRNYYIELKSDITSQAGFNHEIETGYYIQNLNLSYTSNESIDRMSEISISDILNEKFKTSSKSAAALCKSTYKLGGYFQNNWRINDRIFTNFGFRLDYFEMNKQLTFSPRFSGSLNLWANFRLNCASGIYYQSPDFYELKYDYPSHENPKSQKAQHYLLGFRNQLSNTFGLRVDFYYKKYDDLIPYYWQTGRKFSAKENQAEGFAKGIDNQITFKLKNISGWCLAIAF